MSPQDFHHWAPASVAGTNVDVPRKSIVSIRTSSVAILAVRFAGKGAPLLTPENKELLINLTDDQASSITNFRIGLTKFSGEG